MFRINTFFVAVFLLLTFGLGSVHAQEIRVYSDLIERHEISSGETETRTLIIENTSEKERRVVVDLENYLFGVNREKTDIDHDRSLNNFLTFSPSELRIPGNSRKKLTYKVSLPNEASGSYWSLLTIQPIMPGDRLYASRDSTVVVKQRVRWGINIIATAPGGKTSLESLGNNTVGENLQVKVKNNGSVSVRPQFQLRLYNSNGDKITTVTGTKRLIHPNTSVSEKFDLSGVKSGNYSGVVVMDGENGTFGIRVDSIQL